MFDKSLSNRAFSAGVAYDLIEDSRTLLRLSAGPSLAWISGGSKCPTEPSCEDFIPGGSFGTNFKWLINQKFEFLAENLFNAQFNSDSTISNNLLTAIRFYPSIKSNFYLSLSYEKLYDQVKEPRQENNYKFKLGTKF